VKDNKGAYYSGLLHLGILFLLILGLPNWGQDDLLMPEPIGVEIISAKDLNNPAPPKTETKEDVKVDTPPREKEKPLPSPPPPPPPADDIPEEKPVEEKVEEVVEEKIASLDDFLKENPELTELLKEEPKEKPKDPPKEEPKEKPKDKKDKPKEKKSDKKKTDKKPDQKKKVTSDFDSLLNNLEEIDAGPQPTSDSLDEGGAIDLGTILDDNELRAVERQIRSKWNEIVGSDETIPVIVVIIRINPDGTIQNNSLVKGDNTRIAKLATERALRALAHFHHTPLRLPPEKLKNLANKTIKLKFHPS